MHACSLFNRIIKKGRQIKLQFNSFNTEVIKIKVMIAQAGN